MNWFRFHSEALDKAKVQQLPPRLFKTWVNLLCAASENGGQLPPIPDLAFRIRAREVELQKDVSDLCSRKLLDVDEDGFTIPHDWDEWQPKSDVSTDRVKRFRDRKKREAKRDETVSVTEQIRVDQSRSDQRREETAAAATVSAFPETAAAVRTLFPATDDGKLSEIIAEVHALQADADDLEIAAAVQEATRKKQESAGMYKKTLPLVVKQRHSAWVADRERAAESAQREAEDRRRVAEGVLADATSSEREREWAREALEVAGGN